MIDYNTALKIAQELKNTIDICDEYDNAYVFKAEKDKYTIGGDGPCCLLKKDGRALSFTEYIDMYGGKLIRTIELP